MERDNEHLVARIQAGEAVAENMLKLYNQNKGFLAKTAKRYQGYAELEDLMQEGYIGLSEAVDHFEPGQGSSFIHYAAFWIRQCMRRYIDNCTNAVRLPVNVREDIYGYNKAVREYRKYNGEWPSNSALCRLLSVSWEKLQEIKKNVQIGQVQSLSEVVGGEDGELTIEDTIASDQELEEDAIREADTADMKRELWAAVDRLPGDFKEVIRRRYIDGQTLREIGGALGIDGSKADRIEHKALRTLREPGLSRKYHKYYEEYISARGYRHVGVASFMRTGLSEVELEVLGWIR